MSKSANNYLRHIIDEIAFLDHQASVISEEQFMHDEVRQRAFARSLEIIGEATKLIPEDFRVTYPSIDWKAFAGLRDKLIHHYFGIDYALVWDVVTRELPGLKRKLQDILVKNSPSGL